MLNESLLWRKAIDPMSGRLVREETFLTAFLAFTVLVILIGIVAFLFL
jgi:hypothetical protein